AVGELRADDLKFARAAVGGAAGDRREQEKWNRLNAAHQPQMQRRIGQLVDQPAAGYLVHPGAHGGKHLAVPEQPVLAVAQRLEGAQAHQRRERIPEFFLGAEFAGDFGAIDVFLLDGSCRESHDKKRREATSALANLKPSWKRFLAIARARRERPARSERAKLPARAHQSTAT